jgi:bifunctional non-homologous end joining protein LigD
VAGRILFPQTGFTTDDLVEAYEQLAPVLIPHVAQRPLTLKRFPDTIHGEVFWEKDAPSFTPKWIKRFPVPRKHEEGTINYIAIADAKTLRWAASVGCIEIHPFLHKYPFITSPTLIAFDLDPGKGMSIVDCCEVALRVRQWFARYKMQCVAKVSGSKGMQVYVPLNTPASYAITQAVARTVAEELAHAEPRRIISRMARAERAGKIFIDWSQNAEHKTTVSVYSVRAKREQPYVSMPVAWDEVQAALSTRDTEGLTFSPERAVARAGEKGDLFRPVLTMKQKLPAALLNALGLPPPPVPQPVVIARPKKAAYTLPRSSGQGGRKLFVIHRQRDAFELGIEHKGVFVLFRMTKLPSTNSAGVAMDASGRSALEYLTQEGAQSGTVWDLGTYEIVEGAYERGALEIYLTGRRLEGQWKLMRNHGHWMLTNHGGRVMRALAANASALPAAGNAETSGPLEQPTPSTDDARLPGTDLLLSDLPAEKPRFIRKMDCVAVNSIDLIPTGEEWLREVKWDGYRVCIIKEAESVLIRTKSNLEPSARYQHIAASLANSLLPSCTLDGELVALDKEGHPVFQLLQQSRRNDAQVVVYVFDLLNFDGHSLRGLPLRTRRAALEAIAVDLPEYARLSQPLPATTPMPGLVRALEENHLEGIIVKRLDSSYREGNEPGTWVKHRLYRVGEFVIGGYLRRDDPYFDALIVGEMNADRLVYKEKVRFGFDDEKKRELLRRMEPLKTSASPFDNLPEKRRRGALTEQQMREAVWVRPVLRCTVEYTEKTEGGNIRGHGRFGELLN